VCRRLRDDDGELAWHTAFLVIRQSIMHPTGKTCQLSTAPPDEMTRQTDWLGHSLRGSLGTEGGKCSTLEQMRFRFFRFPPVPIGGNGRPPPFGPRSAG